MRLLIFVHGLILALCSASVVLAAKDSQTDIGAMLDQAVATQKVVARKVVAGAQANFSGKKQVTASRPNVLMVAARDTGEVATPKSKSSVASSESRASGAKRASFQKLDVAAESVLREVLDLSSDLAIIAEQQINPPKNQLLVLVTLQPSKFFELDFVELKIDNQIVAAHPYTKKDIASMIRGGGHRLYIANLPAGTHELQAKFVGQVPRDPDYRREAAFKFIAGVNRTLIELYINSRDQNSFPQFTVREWN